MFRCLSRPLRALVMLLLCAASAAAQVPAVQTPSAAPAAAADPLNRETPRGTISGFTSAVHREDFVAAAEYLQLSASQRAMAPDLARDLTALFDRYFTRPVTDLSASQGGIPDDGLPVDRDRVQLSMDRSTVDVLLVRVADPRLGQIWLISSDTLARVPGWRGALEASWVDRRMPEWLLEHSWLGLSWGRWIIWAFSLAVPFLIARLVARLVRRLSRLVVTDPVRRGALDPWIAGLTSPAVVVVALTGHLLALRSLAFPLAFRLNYAHFSLVCYVLALAWLSWRLLTLAFLQAETVAERRGRAGTRSLMLLGERVVKVVLALMTAFAVLTVAGVDTTTALAGIGLGGVALALGAQKTVENLLGGVFLLTDKALAVGDWCRISDRSGRIEDVTLRSVRLRTVEQSLLSIPAGLLSQSAVENFATRNKMLMQNVLRLRYGTSSGQLQSILDRVRALLREHPQIETGSAYIRLVNFGTSAVELELFAYVMTSDNPTFLGVRESVLLAAAAIVESSGSAFAQPADLLSAAGPAGAPGPPPK